MVTGFDDLFEDKEEPKKRTTGFNDLFEEAAPSASRQGRGFDDLLPESVPSEIVKFPTKHPFVQNPDGSRSNVVLGGFEIDGKNYIIPTMVGGKRLSNEEALAIARQNGLDKYPWKATREEADAYAQKIHSLVDEQGNIGSPQPRPTLTPTPYNTPPKPEPQMVDVRTLEQPANLPPGSPPPSMSLKEMREFAAMNAETKRGLETGEIPKSQVIARGIKPFTSVPRMYLMALAPAAAGVGTGLTAAATAIGTGAGINMGVETLDRLMAEGRMPTKEEYAVSGVVGGAVGGIASPVINKPLGATIKRVAQYFGTSPQQVNKAMGQAAEWYGITRGDVADNIILNAAKEPDGAKFFADYLDESARGVTGVEGTKVTDFLPPQPARTTIGEVFRGDRATGDIQRGLVESGVEFQSPAVREAYIGSPFQAPQTREVLRQQAIEESSPFFRPGPRSDVLRQVAPTEKTAKQLADEIAVNTGQTTKDVLKQARATAKATQGKVKDVLVSQAEEIMPVAPRMADFGGGNTVFTREAYEAAKANIAKRAGRLRTGIDPDDLADYVKIGGYYIEGGAREFADWSVRMVDDFGESIKPHLRSIYNESLDAIRKAPRAEDILPSDFNEQAIVSDLTREPAKRTLKNINISRLNDDELSNLIDNAVRESPEFQIPNERVAHAYLQERARRLGTGTIDKYLEPYNPARAGTPEGDIRAIASEVVAVENVMKHHMETDTLPLAHAIKRGEKGNREAFRNALVTDLRLFRKANGVGSEFARGLESRKIKNTGEVGMQQRFLRDVNKVLAKDADLDHIATRLSEIDLFDPTARELFLRDLIKANTRDKIDEFFYNSILSGPITQVRNFLGNVGTMIVRETERPIATTIDLARAAVTGKPRQRFYGESLKSLYGLIEGTREGLAAGRKSFSTEVSQFGLGESILGDLPRSRMTPAIKGTKGRIIRIPSRTLMAADDFFKAVAYRMEINARAYREARKIGIKNKLSHDQMLDIYNELRYRPTDALMQGAREEAILRTYQLKPGKIGGALIGARDNVPMLRYFMPFVRTPLNIMEFGVERVPGINLLSILNRRGQGLAVDWTEELAKTAMGTMIGAGVYLAYKNGIINGYGPQPNSGEEKAFYADGRQRYAFNINGTSVSFANFEPFTTILGMAADTMQLMDEGVPILSGDFAVGLGKALGRNVTGKPFGMGMDTFLNAISGDADKAERGIYRTMSSVVPFSSLARGVAIGLDPTKRKVETLEDAVFGNIPGMRGDMMPVIDLWGREVVNEPGVLQRMASSVGIDLGLPGQILDAMADPSQVQNLSNDPATIEVNRLLSTLPEGESFRGLGTPSQTVKGEKLTREQYIEYSKLSGQRAHRGVLQIISSPFYQRMTDENKKKAIEKQIDMARRRTRDELFSRPR